jgi:hypothetical protein
MREIIYPFTSKEEKQNISWMLICSEESLSNIPSAVSTYTILVHNELHDEAKKNVSDSG